MKLPAGLMDTNIEIFFYEGHLYAIMDGKKELFEELPETIKDFFRAELIKDQDALCGLKKLSIDDPESMLLKYVECNFGGFDNKPDCSKNQILNQEFWCCGKWETCAAFGKICKVPGKLTPRELKISVLVAKGFQDIEIADKVKSTQNTVRTHLSRIYTKLHINNRIELMMWVRDNILNY